MRQFYCFFPLSSTQIPAQEIQWWNTQFGRNQKQIYNNHYDCRNHRCQDKCIPIPDGMVGRQTIASIVQICYHIFKYGIAKYISNNCCYDCHQYRKMQIMPQQFSSGIAGCTQRSDDCRFFCNRIIGGNCKDKCHNRYQDI